MDKRLSFPDWFYTCYYNYTIGETTIKAFTDSKNRTSGTTATYKYSGFNKRHKPVFTLSGQKAAGIRPVSGSTTSFENFEDTTGVLTLTPWAYDIDQSVIENRLGIIRPNYYAFEDYNIASISLYFSQGVEDVYIGKSNEEYYLYDPRGKQWYTSVILRSLASGATQCPFALSFILAEFETYKLRESSLVYNKNVKTVFPSLLSNLEYLTITNVYNVIFSELSAEIYQTRKETYASVDPNSGEQITPFVGVETQRINAPIPRIQRKQTLDTGQWSLTNLDNNPVAAMARYYNIPFNNSYRNLTQQNDTGIQQMLNAADSDFITDWIKRYSGNFNDIRTLQASVFNYLGILASYVCKELKIRYTYLEYVTSIVNYLESIRGLTGRPNYGVNGNYPYFVSIRNAYSKYLLNIFDLFRIEISANDSASTLLGYYNLHIEAYNKWMAGDTTVVNYEIAKLGEDPTSKIKTRLSQVQEFKERFLWAGIDKALNDAYNSDNAFAGNIAINDPAISIKPGDSITLNFLDEAYIPMKVMGVDLVLNVDNIDYSISVKKSILDV